MKTSKINKDCLRGGCERWYFNQDGPNPIALNECARCGFNIAEDEMRKKIPLTLGKDGLRRKIIPAKPQYWPEDKEGGKK